jgi:dimethylglycine catabolism A
MWTPPERIKHPLLESDWPTEESAREALLFQPIHYRALKLRQRTWVPAMVPWRATEEGEVSEAVLRWYERFARGKPGAIVVEATGVRDVPSGPLLRIGHDRYLEGLKRLVDRVHQASEGETRLFIQLIDFLSIKRRPSEETFFHRYFKLDDRHRSMLVERDGDAGWRGADERAVRQKILEGGASLWADLLTSRERRDLHYGYREEVNDLHHEHIRTLPQVLPSLFADATSRAERAGFDGVELHCAHAYTLASFLSETNSRTDGYGGDFSGRLRLPLEVYHAVRQRVSADMVVGCRILTEEVIEGGSSIETTSRYAVELARAGMDFISTSKGGRFEDALQPKVGQAAYPYTGQSGYECMPTVYSDARGPFGRNLGLSRALREAVQRAGEQTPIICAGGIGTFALAEEALQSGSGDIVGAARQSLADPDWFLKAQTGRGAQVRRCQYTNYCEALDAKHKQVTCRLWDRTALDAPDVLLSVDGRRRLEAPLE